MGGIGRITMAIFSKKIKIVEKPTKHETPIFHELMTKWKKKHGNRKPGDLPPGQPMR